MSATRSSASDVAPAWGAAPHRRRPVVAGPLAESSAGHHRRDIDRENVPEADRAERSGGEDAAAEGAAREEARREERTREDIARQDSSREESTRAKGPGRRFGRDAEPW